MCSWQTESHLTQIPGSCLLLVFFLTFGCGSNKTDGDAAEERSPVPSASSTGGSPGNILDASGGVPSPVAAGGSASPAAAGGATGTGPAQSSAASVGAAGASSVVATTVKTTIAIDSSFWTQGYDSTKRPAPADGWHHPGKGCVVAGCHDGSNATTKAFLFAGTVYSDNGLAAAVGAEVGISDGTNSYFAYTANNGNFWIDATAGSKLDFASADIRVVNSKAQSTKKASDGRSADCNTCHSDAPGSGAKILVVP